MLYRVREENLQPSAVLLHINYVLEGVLVLFMHAVAFLSASKDDAFSNGFLPMIRNKKIFSPPPIKKKKLVAYEAKLA